METIPDGTYAVSMKVLHKETNKGLPDLLAVLLDLDNFQDPETGPVILKASSTNPPPPEIDLTKFLANYASYNRLFSGITNAQGEVAGTIKPRDFNTGKESEQKPDLLLLVLAPEEPGLDLNKRLLYLSNDFRVNAGSNEAYIVRLGSALLKEKELAIPKLETDTSIDAKIAAYQKQSAEGEQFRDAILGVEKAKTHDRQNAFTQTRNRFKTLLAPLPINSVGSNFSTFIGDNEKVKDKFDTHYISETVKVAGIIQQYVSEHKGIEVSFILNKADRDTLGFDPGVLNPGHSGAQDFDKSFSNIQTDPALKPILAKMNAAGADNVVLTSNNPILKKCLTKSDDTVYATDSLGLGSSTGAKTASKILIRFHDLPVPAQNYLNGNNGGEGNFLAAFKITNLALVVSYEVRLLADILLHFDGDGINTDNISPMTSADIAVYVKTALTDIRSRYTPANTTAGKSNQESINDNVNKFTSGKAQPNSLPSMIFRF